MRNTTISIQSRRVALVATTLFQIGIIGFAINVNIEHRRISIDDSQTRIHLALAAHPMQKTSTPSKLNPQPKAKIKQTEENNTRPNKKVMSNNLSQEPTTPARQKNKPVIRKTAREKPKNHNNRPVLKAKPLQSKPKKTPIKKILKPKSVKALKPVSVQPDPVKKQESQVVQPVSSHRFSEPFSEFHPLPEKSSATPEKRTADITNTEKAITSQKQERSSPSGSDYEALLANLVQLIDRYKSYPKAARRSRLEGQVQIKITIDKTGRITEFLLYQSSGHRILDKATRLLFKRISGKKIATNEIKSAIHIIVPVRYERL